MTVLGRDLREAVAEARKALAEKCLGLEIAIDNKKITNVGLIKRQKSRIQGMRKHVNRLGQWLKETK